MPALTLPLSLALLLPAAPVPPPKRLPALAPHHLHGRWRMTWQGVTEPVRFRPDGSYRWGQCYQGCWRLTPGGHSLEVLEWSADPAFALRWVVYWERGRDGHFDPECLEARGWWDDTPLRVRLLREHR